MATRTLRIVGCIPKATNTLRICNNNNSNCFCTATIVARTGVNVTLYLQCLSSYILDGAYLLCVTN